MMDLSTMPSASKVLSAYASIVTTTMLVRTIANQLIPHQFQSYIFSRLNSIFAAPFSPRLFTIVVDQSINGFPTNQFFDASEIYLRSKLTLFYSSSSMDRIKVAKTPLDKTLLLDLDKDQEFIDFFHGIPLKWKLIHRQPKTPSSDDDTDSVYFELTFDKKHKDIVLASYLPYVEEESKALKEAKKVVKLYSRGGGPWRSINFDHPATFDKLAMDPDLKRALIDDLDRFVKRREFYKRVGKAWKRGYLLYGPPGTGKSSLIAAMANYLSFDIYDIELTSTSSNSELRGLLVSTTNRSILVIEDIDCSIEMEDREHDIGGISSKGIPSKDQVHKRGRSAKNQLTLSGLLNFIDGLWSNCGDERIIVFTTNYKDRLDPALLRPGRMDMHIHMSYCTPAGFRILASNYLGICEHPLFEKIERLIENVEVTPAEVAEELIKYDDVEITLNGLISFIHRKNMERDRLRSQEEKISDGEKKVDEFEGGGQNGQMNEKQEYKQHKSSPKKRRIRSNGPFSTRAKVARS